MYRNMKRVFVTCIIRIGINFWKQNCVDKQIDIYLDTLIAVTKKVKLVACTKFICSSKDRLSPICRCQDFLVGT